MDSSPAFTNRRIFVVRIVVSARLLAVGPLGFHASRAAAAANAKLRYQNAHLRRAAEGGEADGGGEAALAAAKAEGGRPPLPIDVVPLREMTRERFRDEYQRPNRPVVLRDALAEWPASGKWSIPWFRENYGDADVEVSLDGAQAGAKPF